MNIASSSDGALGRLAATIGQFFNRPAQLQVAALCYRNGHHGPEVLLITTRDTRRWIIPKGWPVPNASLRKTARIEAFEEAGIEGKIGREPIGSFRSFKGLGKGVTMPTEVLVFPLKVRKKLKKYPEQAERDLAWLPVEEAAKRCAEDGLRELLLSDAVRELLAEKN